ncbi:MAG: ABC transporter permease, partial [Clostridia bacterium]|nr:ABC transporter permease [Clostridia bacterium]
IWLLSFLSGMLFGALWGIIPGFFRAYLNINEVLSSIMTNWIAANLVTLIFENSPLRNGAESGKVGYIMKTSANGVATATLGLDKIFKGSQINAGFLVACLFAVIVYIVISKTVFGFELKTCGSNRYAAEYAGIKSKNRIVSVMALSGALSGAGAALYYLSGNTEFFWSTYQSLPFEGFRGIPIALLALSNPIGVIFSGSFMSALSIAGQQLKNFTSFSEHLTDIIIAIIVYISAFSLIIRNILSSKKTFTIKSTSFPFNLLKKEIETSEKEEE